MPIISSVIKSSQLQLNGTSLVHEQHIDNNGKIYDHVYFADAGIDTNAAMSLRATNMGAEIDRRAAVALAALDFEIPLTQLEIMRRVTPAEWNAFRSSVVVNVVYFREVFDKANTIYRSDPLTQQGFAMLLAEGIFATTARVAEVLA